MMEVHWISLIKLSCSGWCLFGSLSFLSNLKVLGQHNCFSLTLQYFFNLETPAEIASVSDFGVKKKGKARIAPMGHGHVFTKHDFPSIITEEV